MRAYRCINEECTGGNPKGLDFFAEKPMCPDCGSDQTSGLVFPLAVIHYDPPSRVRGKGINKLACQPTKAIFGRMATAHAPAVTCYACRQTESWKEALARLTQEV